MNKSVIVAALLMAASSSSALAAGPYVGGSAGVSFLHDSDVRAGGNAFEFSYDAGYNLNVYGGYNFDIVRLEGEFGYKKADIDQVSGFGLTGNMPNSDVSVMSFMANCYYDMKNSSPVTPFVGVGIGALRERYKLQGVAKTDNLFGYQFSAGASYSLSRHLNLDLSYRYQASATDFSRSNVDIEYKSSSLLLGMRYMF